MARGTASLSLSTLLRYRSLAVDFQLYATVLPFLTFAYAWRPAAGWLALGATTAASLAVSVWVVVDKSLSSLLDANGQIEALGLTGDTFKFVPRRVQR